uniref:Uncharacterized protein n=1 Tax=Anguilla anguilla TaxID=7936 RepID=A0A0E9SQJ8_ANGAN
MYTQYERIQFTTTNILKMLYSSLTKNTLSMG